MSNSSGKQLGDTEEFPSHIGRYRIAGSLGSGGFGDVYLGYDERLERQVAIKVPNQQLLEDRLNLEQYQSEARLVAKLDHPAIVPVFDVGSSDEFPFFVVSKYVDGRDLRLHLKYTDLNFASAIELTVQIADALQYAHKQGVVHRDVKPSNILMDGESRPHLADFGLALDERATLRYYRYAGTPAYMSPEQARGEGHRIDGRSDVFALGAVLYELLTGKRAFRGETSSELRDKVQFVEPRPLRQYDETLPREAERICMKALAKRAKDRYQTAFDFAEDLKELLASSASTRIGSAVSIPEQSVPRSTTRQESNEQIDTPRPEQQKTDTVVPDSLPIDSSSPVVVPKGLHSFNEHDADFFLELLPGARDRQGVPDQIRFWVRQIESRTEESFSVGLIYGPSGSGKSSLVKAGLIPLLSSNILPVFVESTASATEDNTLRALKRLIPALEDTSSLAEALSRIRRGHHLQPNQKVLLVLDQFEQWLNMHRDPSDSELVHALRQADGQRIQVIVLIRSDFWMTVTRFFEELEVDLHQGANVAAVDLFPPRHAKKVLTAFGQAMGSLPKGSELTDDHHTFIEQAVRELTQNGTVICVRLAVYAEMMKNKVWSTTTLKQLGGIEGVGSRFLEESFGPQASPAHRIHEDGAKAVLKALLPETGTLISSQIQPYEQLKLASGYADDKQFQTLVRILDSDLRLISPTDPSGIKKAAEERSDAGDPSSGVKYYRLTHDYLISALRNWLQRKQRETMRGRAELALEERAAYWEGHQENRFLPSLAEHVRIRLFTQEKSWNTGESGMMAAALRYHMTWFISVTAILLLLVWGGSSLLQQAKRSSDQRTVSALIDGLLKSDTSKVQGYVSRLDAYETSAELPLHEKFMSALDGSTEKLHAAMALAKTHRDCSEYLQYQLPMVAANRFPFVLSTVQASTALDQEFLVRTIRDEESSLRQQLQAACALASSFPNHEFWQEEGFTAKVAYQLTQLYPSELAPLRATLLPVSKPLVDHLRAIYLDSKNDEQQRAFAAESLVEFASDDPDLLAQFLLESDERQFQLVFDALGNHQELLAEVARQQLALQVEAEAGTWDVGAYQKQANAAVALFRIGEHPLLWPLLRESEDPTLRSLLIHFLANRGANPEPLMTRLSQEQDSGVQQALLYCLGEFDSALIGGEQTEQLLGMATEIAKRADQAGLRAAALWFLRSQKQFDLAEKLRLETSRLEFPSEGKQASRLAELLAFSSSEVRSQWQQQLSDYEPIAVEDIRGFQKQFPLAETSELESQSDQAVESVASPFGPAIRTMGKEGVAIEAGKEVTPTGAFSVCMWMQLRPYESYGSLISKMNEDFRGFDLWQEGRQVAVHIKSHWYGTEDENNRWIKILADPVLTDGGWHFICASYDGSGAAAGVTVYFNGEVASTKVLSDTLDGDHTNDGPWLLGGRPNAYPASVAARDLIFFDHPLNDQQIQQMYLQYLAPIFAMEAGKRTVKQRDLLERIIASTPAGKAADSEFEAFHQARIQSLVDSPANWYTNQQGQTLVRIQADQFRMGTLQMDSPFWEYETPHQQTLNRVYGISDSEVTVAQFKKFYDEGHLSSDSRERLSDIAERNPDDPITGLTWFDAAEYCNWLSKAEGIPDSEWCFVPESGSEYGPNMRLRTRFWEKSGYRLPTQAEWEYACRAGTTSPRSFGRPDLLLDKYAWYIGNSFSEQERIAYQRAVRLLKPNGYGLFDMHGNAMEWCIDPHEFFAYNGEEMIDEPKTDEKVGFAQRSLRGAAYYDLPAYIGSGCRYGYEPTGQLISTGLRVVQTLKIAEE